MTTGIVTSTSLFDWENWVKKRWIGKYQIIFQSIKYLVLQLGITPFAKCNILHIHVMHHDNGGLLSFFINIQSKQWDSNSGFEAWYEAKT